MGVTCDGADAPMLSGKGDDRPARRMNTDVSRSISHKTRGLEAATDQRSIFMHTRLLSLLSRRLLIPVLLVGLSLGGVSLALVQHAFSAHAAASSSHPYYVMVIGGQKYVAQ